MRRIEGFIDLNRMLTKKEIKLYDHDYDFIPSRVSSFIDDNNDIYFFKESMMSEPYNELLAEELLKDFNLPHAEYDLAIYGNRKGVITKSFIDKNKKYYFGENIIKDYNKALNKEFDVTDNNLENIWDALEYKYRDNPNKEIIVSHLMNQIVDMYIFDILTGNCDRYYWNYQIEEGKEGINIAPIYDSEAIMINTNNPSFFVAGDIDKNNKPNLYEELEKFISYSESSYIDRIKDKLWIISGKNIDSVLERVEKKIGYEIPDELAVEYIKGFLEHKEKLEELLNKLDKGNSRGK